MTVEHLRGNSEWGGIIQASIVFGPSGKWPMEKHWQVRLNWWFGGLLIEFNPSRKEIDRAWKFNS